MNSLNTVAEQPRASSGALIDIGIVVGISIALYLLETALRSSGVINWREDSTGVIAVVGGALVALAIVRYRGESLASLGFRRPQRWLTAPLWAIGILAAYLAAQAVIPPLLGFFIEIPPPDLSRHNPIYQNLPQALLLALLLPVTASIPEEIIYRGFILNRLLRSFGDSPAGLIAAVVVQGLIFGSVHFGWGIGGMFATAIMGMIWGAAYIMCGRNLWIMIIAHSLAHILFVVQLYHVDTGVSG